MIKYINHIATAIIASTAACLGGYFIYKIHNKKQLVKKKVHEIVLIFDHKEVFIKNIVFFREKIKRFFEDGGNKLQVLSDFDRTLSKHFVEGEKGFTSFGVVEHSQYFPTYVKKQLLSLHEKYHPIEMSTTITEEAKIPYMVDWWAEAFMLAVNAGVQKRQIPDMVRNSRVVLRDGADQFFHLLHEKNIPLLIVSAGLGDIINEVMLQQAELTRNISITANFYTFNSEGLATGLRGNEMIHSFNKNQHLKQRTDYFEKHKDRTNLIVMGDTLGDPSMADGIFPSENVLKIGFLNEKTEESLNAYLEVYDVVLTNDANLDRLTVFLHALLC
ncbi:7-methylguanosine phosphate-specific 5'-nucleotidase A isoform X1 [Hydra vulgaris]|uniref:5'-nucleotidase n=1 Tax=Hydra vulgaris TaxID=6087 RepID=A0ABM4C1B4_HYDVU